jgi:argininosuccinate lyase
MNAFNQSLHYDKRMYAVDIQGSIAYAKALALGGILTNDECQKMITGLNAVLQEWQEGKARIA